ncbi:MAG: hypothetical protein ACRCW3_03505 [Metamycoplasmataceae bacterium]
MLIVKKGSMIITNIKRMTLLFTVTVLTISPNILAMLFVSCSLESQIEIEIKKFKNSAITKKQITSLEAVEAITNAINEQEKEEILRFFVDIPELSSEFDLEILSANINKEENNAIDVYIKVFETNNPENYRNIIWIVNDFIILNSTIDQEVLKFNRSTETTRSDLTSVQAIEMIQKLSSMETLRELTNIPEYEKGFEFFVFQSNMDAILNTTINVYIIITREININNEMKIAILQITGFKPSLELEIIKFKTPTETIRNDMLANEAVESIESISDPIDKLNALKTLVNIPVIHDDFYIEILYAMVNSRVKTTVDVILRIHEINHINDSGDVLFQITGFKSPNS